MPPWLRELMGLGRKLITPRATTAEVYRTRQTADAAGQLEELIGRWSHRPDIEPANYIARQMAAAEPEVATAIPLMQREYVGETGTIIQRPIRGAPLTTEHRAAIITPGRKPVLVQGVSHIDAYMGAQDAGLIKGLDKTEGAVEGFIREGMLVDDRGLPITVSNPGRTAESAAEQARQRETIRRFYSQLAPSEKIAGEIGEAGRVWATAPLFTTPVLMEELGDEGPDIAYVQAGKPGGDAHDNIYEGIARDITAFNQDKELVVSPLQQEHLNRVLNMVGPEVPYSEPLLMPEVPVEAITAVPDVTAMPDDYRRAREFQPTIGAVETPVEDVIPLARAAARDVAAAEMGPLEMILNYADRELRGELIPAITFGLSSKIPGLKQITRSRVEEVEARRRANIPKSVAEEVVSAGENIGLLFFPESAAGPAARAAAGVGRTAARLTPGERLLQRRVSQGLTEPLLSGPILEAFAPSRRIRLPRGAPRVLGGTEAEIAAREAGAARQTLDYLVEQGAPPDITGSFFRQYMEEIGDPYIGKMLEGRIFQAMTGARGGEIATVTGQFVPETGMLLPDVLTAGGAMPGSKEAIGALGITGVRRLQRAIREAYPEAVAAEYRHVAGTAPGRTRRMLSPRMGTAEGTSKVVSSTGRAGARANTALSKALPAATGAALGAAGGRSVAGEEDKTKGTVIGALLGLAAGRGWGRLVGGR